MSGLWLELEDGRRLGREATAGGSPVRAAMVTNAPAVTVRAPEAGGLAEASHSELRIAHHPFEPWGFWTHRDGTWPPAEDAAPEPATLRTGRGGTALAVGALDWRGLENHELRFDFIQPGDDTPLLDWVYTESWKGVAAVAMDGGRLVVEAAGHGLEPGKKAVLADLDVSAWANHQAYRDPLTVEGVDGDWVTLELPGWMTPGAVGAQGAGRIGEASPRPIQFGTVPHFVPLMRDTDELWSAGHDPAGPGTAHDDGQEVGRWPSGAQTLATPPTADVIKLNGDLVGEPSLTWPSAMGATLGEAVAWAAAGRLGYAADLAGAAEAAGMALDHGWSRQAKLRDWLAELGRVFACVVDIDDAAGVVRLVDPLEDGPDDGEFFRRGTVGGLDKAAHTATASAELLTRIPVEGARNSLGSRSVPVEVGGGAGQDRSLNVLAATEAAAEAQLARQRRLANAPRQSVTLSGIVPLPLGWRETWNDRSEGLTLKGRVVEVRHDWGTQTTTARCVVRLFPLAR